MATRDLWRNRGYNEPRYNNDYNYDRYEVLLLTLIIRKFFP